MRRLVCLDVSENRLAELPSEISGLIALTDLLLSQNILELVPDSIGEIISISITNADVREICMYCATEYGGFTVNQDYCMLKEHSF